ncbi:MAG TPA: hypothetical protein PKX23_13295, partial [Verrucomicrobiota bacterium]|nr:hypothetical protein [Verrucomicrobiota bacterium]
MNAKERLPAVGLLAALLLPIVNGLVVSAQAPSRALDASPHARPGGSAAMPSRDNLWRVWENLPPEHRP